MASANYNTEIPADLFTDDDASVDGVTLQFRDGMPMPATVSASYGEVDFTERYRCSSTWCRSPALKQFALVPRSSSREESPNRTG